MDSGQLYSYLMIIQHVSIQVKKCSITVNPILPFWYTLQHGGLCGFPIVRPNGPTMLLLPNFIEFLYVYLQYYVHLFIIYRINTNSQVTGFWSAVLQILPCSADLSVYMMY